MNASRFAAHMAAGLLVFAAACGGADDDSQPAATDPDASGLNDTLVEVDAGADVLTSDTAALTELGPDVPYFAAPTGFDRFCLGKDWQQALTPATLAKLSGNYKGFLKETAPGVPFKAGTLETMKVIAQHPFRVKKIRVAFAGGAGKARIRLMKTVGRSYPGSFPNMLDSSADLVAPVDIAVTAADPNTWLELDVSASNALLLPTEHYMLVYEHLGPGPYLAVEDVPEGEYSRALLFVPGSLEAYGLGPQNFRMELVGDEFCRWSEGERWFGPVAGQPFAEAPSSAMQVVDLNGDGHDDLVLMVSTLFDAAKKVSEPKPTAFWGDGKGGFTKAAGDVFPGTRAPGLMVFGDVDNDGDMDALSLSSVSTDGDLDGHGKADTPPDCNDADPAIHPGAEEVDKNGLDDDCDGVVDDGKSLSDVDMDGVSVAEGDCDDTRATVLPSAMEVRDGLDNDCDGKVDEDFYSRLLLNDGKGQFTVKAQAGIEILDPSTAAGFNDGNGDGKLDVYWGNWLKKYPTDAAVQDRYFEGKGDGTFVDKAKAAGLVLPQAYSVYGVTWNDYNGDGWPDIFVGNYHLYPNQLWQNQGDGTFVDVAKQVGLAQDDIKAPISVRVGGLTGGHSYGADFGDMDNDGDVDAFVTNLAHPRTQPWSDPSVYAVNSGAPDFSFSNQTSNAGFIYDEGDVNVSFGDFDNDGDLDVALATLYQGHYSKLYRNDGAAGFVDVTYETGTAVHDAVGVIWADVDEDGDLDLFVAGRGVGSREVQLFNNRVGSKHKWVKLVLEGKTANRQALGARVTLSAGGVTQLRDVRGGGSGHNNTQHPRTVHFGLGSNETIDKIEVRWPGSATTEVISGAAPGATWLIVQGSGKAMSP